MCIKLPKVGLLFTLRAAPAARISKSAFHHFGILLFHVFRLRDSDFPTVAEHPAVKDRACRRLRFHGKRVVAKGLCFHIFAECVHHRIIIALSHKSVTRSRRLSYMLVIVRICRINSSFSGRGSASSSKISGQRSMRSTRKLTSFSCLSEYPTT